MQKTRELLRDQFVGIEPITPIVSRIQTFLLIRGGDRNYPAPNKRQGEALHFGELCDNSLRAFPSPGPTCVLPGGFKRCLYPTQRFQSDPERRFAILCENDPDVLKCL